MSKRVVVITALGYPERLPHAEFCFNTWRWWCRKNGIEFFILTEAPPGPYPLKPSWDRYRLFDILEHEGIDFDQALLVDADTMIRWDCPDFFLLSGDRLGVVRDTLRKWVQGSMRIYAHFFPGSLLTWEEYFNAGFIVLNKSHRQLFRDILDFHRSNRVELEDIENRENLGTDQTPVNYIVERNGIARKYLPQVFNRLHFIPRDYSRYDDAGVKGVPLERFLSIAYVWHFGGIPRHFLSKLMGLMWDMTKHRYSAGV